MEEKTTKLEKHYASGSYHMEVTKQFNLATEDFQNVLNIAEEIDDRKQITNANIGLGNAYCSNNQIQLAIECHQKALELATKQENKKGEIEAHIGLGDSYRRDKKKQKAIRHYKMAVEIVHQERYGHLEELATNAIQELSGIPGTLYIRSFGCEYLVGNKGAAPLFKDRIGTEYKLLTSTKFFRLCFGYQNLVIKIEVLVLMQFRKLNVLK